MGEGRPQALQKKILFFLELNHAGFEFAEENGLGALVEEAGRGWAWGRRGGGRAPSVGGGDGASNIDNN